MSIEKAVEHFFSKNLIIHKQGKQELEELVRQNNPDAMHMMGEYFIYNREVEKGKDLILKSANEFHNVQSMLLILIDTILDRVWKYDVRQARLWYEKIIHCSQTQPQVAYFQDLAKLAWMRHLCDCLQETQKADLQQEIKQLAIELSDHGFKEGMHVLALSYAEENNKEQAVNILEKARKHHAPVSTEIHKPAFFSDRLFRIDDTILNNIIDQLLAKLN